MSNTYISDYIVTEPIPALRAGRTGAPKTYTKGGEFGRGGITFSDIQAADSTITLNGIVVQFSASASDATAAGTALDPILVNIKASLTLTLDEAATVLNAATHAELAVATYSNSGGTVLLVVYDTRTSDANSYTLVASAESNGTVTGATLTGGQADVALSLDTENIEITLTDSNTQYFTLADAPEFTSKTIVLTEKGDGNAVITYNGTSTLTYDAASEHSVLKFLNGDYRIVVNTATAA